MISNQEPTILYTVVNGVITPIGSLVVGPNGTLIISSSSSGGGSGSGKFDANGNPRIYDPVNVGYWTLTADGGRATFTAFSANP